MSVYAEADRVGADRQVRLPTALAASITVRDDVPAEVCDEYVRTHPEASAYHRPAWLDVIARAFGHRTCYLVAESDDRVVGVLPLVFFRSRLFGHFAVSVPFVNYGGIAADHGGAERALLGRALEHCRAAGASHVELRHTRRIFPELSARHHKVAMTLALEASPDAQWQRLDRKVRNQVRKGEKSGLQVADGGVERLDEFYTVFAHNMRDLGTPVYGKRFFNQVLSTFPETTRVFVARHGARPVAASIVQWHRDTIDVPWASAIREFNPLCANVLLYWHMLKFASERGLRTFDFGRSTPNEGTFHFKKQWGALPQPLVWEYWTAEGAAVPNLNPANPKFDLAIRVWQKLPVSVATAVGPHIVRNIP